MFNQIDFTRHTLYINITMDKYKDFPEPPRQMTDEEGEHYFFNMLKQIQDFDPDEIIAVARSGFSYASWISQVLKLPLGAYWPREETLVFTHDRHRDLKIHRVVFVDDNILGGSTLRKTKSMMKELYPQIDYRWAVLFSDWHTPPNVREEIIQGTQLPYFAEEPLWGSKKVSIDYGVRFRDEE